MHLNLDKGKLIKPPKWNLILSSQLLEFSESMLTIPLNLKETDTAQLLYIDNKVNVKTEFLY